jgi:hypothetical protein
VRERQKQRGPALFAFSLENCVVGWGRVDGAVGRNFGAKLNIFFVFF